MSLFPKQNQSNYMFLPKVGEEKTVVVLGEVQRITEEGSLFNYKKQGNVNVGYHDVLPVIDNDTGKEEKLLINVWKFYFDLKELNDINVNDTININHECKNVYKITKI